MSRNTSPLPLAIFDQHVAVLGKTRSGKSSAMRGCVESLLSRQLPVCVIDPKGDWWGIKLAADGKGPGFPVVIFGGEHADVPIDAHAGAAVAELYATENRPCLIDLGGWMVGERTRFWVDFASTLFKLTKGRRWLVIDEIHNFAPKGKIADPEAGKALHWANRLASEGLGKGLSMLFASQRPQKVHNDTLTSAETLIAMRVLHPSDREAIADWVKGCGDTALGAEVLQSLSQLNRGEGWAWSPEAKFGPKRVTFPMFQTYDSFRPQTAEDSAALRGWADVDLAVVRERLAAVVATAKANDPKELKKENAALKKELADLRLAALSVPVPPPADPALGAEQRQFVTDAIDEFRAVSDTVVRAIRELGVPPRKPAPSLVEAAASAGLIRPIPAPARLMSAARAGIAADLSAPQQRILVVCCELERRGLVATRDSLAAWLGLHPNGGSFSTNLGDLRALGYLNQLQLTSSGREMASTLIAAGSVGTITAGSAGALAACQREGQRSILSLLHSHPAGLPREQLAQSLGIHPNGGSFGENIAFVRKLGVVTEKWPLTLTSAYFA